MNATALLNKVRKLSDEENYPEQEKLVRRSRAKKIADVIKRSEPLASASVDVTTNGVVGPTQKTDRRRNAPKANTTNNTEGGNLMDPNRVLADMRVISEKMRNGHLFDNDQMIELGRSLQARFDMLDSWFSKGGYVPVEWGPGGILSYTQ